jgi:hypothetical protein
MEGWGILEIMKELESHNIKVTKIIHDKDSSTMTNVMDVYEDVTEALCLGNNFNSLSDQLQPMAARISRRK